MVFWGNNLVGGSWLPTFRDKISVSCLTLEDGTDILSRNVVSQLPPTQLLPQEKESLKTQQCGRLESRYYNHSIRNNISYNNSESQTTLYLHHFKGRTGDRRNKKKRDRDGGSMVFFQLKFCIINRIPLRRLYVTLKEFVT